MTGFAEHLQDALGANYQLDRELTGGGMSRVFIAVDRVLGRKVVVKVLPPELAAGVNRDRFRREVQVAAQLQHPHVVPLLSAGEQGDLLWYTMPYIEGESLRAALERKRQFSVREVTRILHDIVDALAFAHAHGVIHRDIKPANILTQGSHALVADFGVAKALSAAMPLSGVTSAGIAIGTPAYMAPEQLAGDTTADHRMDIYAVGLLAYELVTGVSPFTGPSPRETLAAQLTRDPTPLHEISAEVPRSLSALIMRCLAKDPAQRPQTADEILHELDSMTMPLGVTPTNGETRTVRARRPWMGAAAVAILALVIAGVGYAVARARGTPPSNAQIVPPAVTPPPQVTTAADTVKKAPIAPPKPAKPVLTHADSVRIAEIVRKRIEAAKISDSIAKAKAADEMQRKVTDSIISANSGGATTAATTPRRLVIAEPPEQRLWPEAQVLARAVADSLRRMLRGRRQQFSVVDQDSVRAALTKTRGATEISKALNADLIVAINLQPFRGDSGFLVVQSFDLGAVPQYRTRSAGSRPAPRNEVLSGLDQVLLSTLGSLEEMSRAPRRPPAPTP
jgi:serine/threonine-protein kinase